MTRRSANTVRSFMLIAIMLIAAASPALAIAQDTGTGGPSGIEIVWSNQENAPPAIGMSSISISPFYEGSYTSTGSLIPFSIVFSFPETENGGVYELRARVSSFVNTANDARTLDPAEVSFSGLPIIADQRLTYFTETPVPSGDGLWHPLVSIDLTAGGSGIFEFYGGGTDGEILLHLVTWHPSLTLATGSYTGNLELELVRVDLQT